MSVWNRSHPVLSPLQQHLTPNGGIAVVEYASTIIAIRNLFALFFQTPSNAHLYGRFCEWKLKILFGLLSDVLRLTCSPDIRVPTQYAFIVSCISSSVSKAYLAPEIKTSMLKWWAEQKLMCYSYVLLFPQLYYYSTQFRRGILLETMPWPRQFSKVSVRIHCEQAATTALLIACFTITTSACKFHGIGFKYEIYMSNTFIPVCKYSACCCAIYFGTRASQFIPYESLCPPNWMKPKQKRWTIKWNPIWMQSGSIDLLLLSKKWMKWSE